MRGIRTLCALAVPATALFAVGTGAPAVAATAPANHTGTATHQSPIRARMSGTIADSGIGLPDLGGGNDDSAVAQAFPGTGVPQIPDGFAPDSIVNQDRSALPHNETSVAINPTNPQNLLVGANDYSAGFGTSGFYTSFDGGQSWYGGTLNFPALTNYAVTGTNSGAPDHPKVLDVMDGGGDPSVVFDSQGVAYYAEINFHRSGCVGGVFVYRSTNNGQTWSRPENVPSAGDPRPAGDGIVADNTEDNNCNIFFDKEMITTGRRPAGVLPASNADPAHLSQDRLYVTFTEFGQNPAVGGYLAAANAASTASPIYLSYSDDQGRHWSTPAYIGGTSDTYCGGSNATYPAPPAAHACVDSQGSDPAVDPNTGKLYVAFWNGDYALGADGQIISGASCATGQVLVVGSGDGGQTFGAPTQAACPNYSFPTDNQSDANCPGGAGNPVVSGYCFRVPTATEQSIAVNPKDGSVHVAFPTNTGGTAWPLGSSGSNLDVQTSSSNDGGTTWAAPVTVNQTTAGDQFFPWSSFGLDGTYYVSFLDRSLDAGLNHIGESVAISTTDGRSFVQHALSTGTFDGSLGFRDGLFLGDYTGIAAGPNGAYAAWPDTRRSGSFHAGDNPADFWSDVAGAGITPDGSTIGSLPVSLSESPSRLGLLPLVLLPGIAAVVIIRRRRMVGRLVRQSS